MSLGLILTAAYFFTSSNTLDNKDSPDKIVVEAKPKKEVTYTNITADELKSYLDQDKEIFLLDVHIPEQEHINGTDDFISYTELSENISELPTEKDAEIVVYCRSGSMSKTASQTLIEMGYKNVKNLSGGINAWKEKGYDL